jgi:hypothetical protein
VSTVAAAYSAGWTRVKLYFMCGLPGETIDDVLAIAEMAKRVISTGREVSGRRDIGCTISLGSFVPKPHTPFQWAAQASNTEVDERIQALKEAIRSDKRFARAIGLKYSDARPGLIEGLLARGDRRVGGVIEEVWRNGGTFDGWREYFSFERWTSAAEHVLSPLGISLDWYTTRQREEDEILPWDHLDSGLDRDWLWDDWQDALAEVSVPDCRWAGCTDCGVCPDLDLYIQIGPTGETLRPLATTSTSGQPTHPTAYNQETNHG